MRLARPGGVFIAFTPTNNFCGHGFYQFSPELWFRVLQPANGFQVESMIAWEEMEGSRFYEIPDPAAVRTRVEFLTRRSTYLFVQARKQKDCRLLEQPVPQQSDYAAAWSTSSEESFRGGVLPPASWQVRARLFAGRLGVLEALRSTALFRRLRDRAYRVGQLSENTRSYFRPIDGLRVDL